MASNTAPPSRAISHRSVVLVTILYVHLWVVEGAIRKWVPGTEQLMYVARDAVIVLAIGTAALFFGANMRRSGLPPWLAALVITVLSAAQVMVGLIPLDVGLVGLRSYIAPILLLSFLWCFGAPDILERIVRVILLYGPVQLIVSVLQVLSSKTDWINKQVGSDVAYFVNGQVVRASGTFSAPAGLTLFVPLCFALSLWALHCNSRPLRILAIIALASSIAVTVVSGARGTVLAVSIVLFVYVLFKIATLDTSAVRAVVGILVFAGGIAYSSIALFPTVFASFIARFENAAQGEDSSERVFNQTFDFLWTPMTVLGDGVGAHSQAGLALGAEGPWIEIESVRWVAELGLIGWTLALLRIIFCLIVPLLIILLWRRNGLFASLVFACLGPVILYGQITQFPSAQAFCSVCLALVLLFHRADRELESSGA